MSVATHTLGVDTIEDKTSKTNETLVKSIETLKSTIFPVLPGVTTVLPKESVSFLLKSKSCKLQSIFATPNIVLFPTTKFPNLMFVPLAVSFIVAFE